MSENTNEIETDDINSFDDESPRTEPRKRRKDVQLIKHTETIDNLRVQARDLQKDLDEAEDEIDGLHDRLENSHIRISKTLFYSGLVFAGFLFYSANTQLNDIKANLIEMNTIIKEYKDEIEKTKLYNDILEKKLNIATKKD